MEGFDMGGLRHSDVVERINLPDEATIQAEKTHVQHLATSGAFDQANLTPVKVMEPLTGPEVSKLEKAGEGISSDLVAFDKADLKEEESKEGGRVRRKWSAGRSVVKKKNGKNKARSRCTQKVRYDYLDLVWLCHQGKGGCNETNPPISFRCTCGIWRCTNPSCNELNAGGCCTVCKTPGTLSRGVEVAVAMTTQGQEAGNQDIFFDCDPEEAEKEAVARAEEVVYRRICISSFHNIAISGDRQKEGSWIVLWLRPQRTAEGE